MTQKEKNTNWKIYEVELCDGEMHGVIVPKFFTKIDLERHLRMVFGKGNWIRYEILAGGDKEEE